MHVVVTGAAGFIGPFLVRELVEHGHTVRGVDRAPMDDLPLETSVVGDLADPAVAREAVCGGVDRIYHLAAARGDWGISEEEYYHDNVEATRALLEAGEEAGVRDWVFYSTVSTMGPSDVPLDEGAELQPAVPYGRSKAEAEQLFHAFADDHPSCRILMVRPSAVYGPENPPDTNIYRLIESISAGRFAMVGDGSARKTTSYIENLIAATTFLTDRLSEGLEVFIYVDEPVLSTKTLVQEIYRLLGKRPPSWHIPLSVAKPIASLADLGAQVTGIDFPITASRIEKFCTSTYFDGSAIRELGFQQPVSNKEALRRTVDWHLRHENGAPPPNDA